MSALSHGRFWADRMDSSDTAPVDLVDARKRFIELQAQQPDLYEANWGLGESRRLIARFSGEDRAEELRLAIEAFNRTLKLSKDADHRSVAYRNLAMCYATIPNHKDALRFADLATQHRDADARKDFRREIDQLCIDIAADGKAKGSITSAAERGRDTSRHKL